MSPAAGRQPKPVKPKPVKPWRRVEPGRYRSSDERFTLESDGGGRWFVTDGAELDDLGLARTTGPFATLGVAKAATDVARDRPTAASPLAARLADAASRPKRAVEAAETTVPGVSLDREPRTWLDDLVDRDPEVARRAHGLIAALEREGMADAATLVRKDVLGDTPAIATSLLARDLVTAVARLHDPRPVDVLEAVVGVLAEPRVRDGLPGWELVDRDGPGGRTRRMRLTKDDLR